ncbi:hypothetical protein ACEZ3G_13175 [Maribacter algicola]|uniref:Uncharacterized protein n=1 Tax=Meishania litoralis TaxID=3434685 RepID=A0ACC7LKW2_9FLAO
MHKIEIKGSSEDLQRISIFLDNNYIKYDIVDDRQDSILEEIEGTIDWPF